MSRSILPIGANATTSLPTIPTTDPMMLPRSWSTPTTRSIVPLPSLKCAKNLSTPVAHRSNMLASTCAIGAKSAMKLSPPCASRPTPVPTLSIRGRTFCENTVKSCRVCGSLIAAAVPRTKSCMPRFEFIRKLWMAGCLRNLVPALNACVRTGYQPFVMPCVTAVAAAARRLRAAAALSTAGLPVASL